MGARRAPASSHEKLLLAVSFGTVAGVVAALFLTFSSHYWILDASGRPVVEDFAAFWAAGHLAATGHAVAAYDANLQHAAETAAVGHPFSVTLGWSYPPVFLIVAAMLAQLPYTLSFLTWCLATLSLYAATVAGILERRAGLLMACAAPWVLTGLMPGQNGFLTAALAGLALLFLEKRPIAAGLILGLLTYKPQFGILFPLALAAGGYWRTFFWAGVSAIIVNLAAGAIFGFDTLSAFLHALLFAGQNHLANAGLGWNKLQSVYGLARSAGFSGAVAWEMQACEIAVLAVAVIAVWRAPLSYSVKAAFLAAAIPLATPYVFVYDLPILSVAVAFLAREKAFDRTDWVLLATTAPNIYGFLWLPIPTAFFASLAVFILAARRCQVVLPRGLIRPSWLTEATSVPSSE
jgi:arabinofuranan 3-O-arabinosyltransferase